MPKVLDFEKLCRDHNVAIADETEKQYRDGWINISCPFCGRPDKYFLGFEEDTGRITCWNCGWKKTIDTVAKIAGVSKARAWHLMSKYSGFILRRKKRDRRLADKCILPSNNALTKKHYKHLSTRGITKDALEPWQPVATGPIGPYKHRIIFPVYLNGMLISYQGYDWTRRSKLKYKACSITGEVVPHQEALLGLDLVPKNSVVVVEGIMDAIKLGPGAVCCFGINWSKQQANLLKQFEKVFVMFDMEKQAQNMAKDLCKYLYIPGRPSPEILILTDEDEAADPGELAPEKAESIMKDLGVR